ncbi:hypothetical protein L798_11258 [Zootermopsis nevadensis]|nr:hypothetical protein L798_11258 [Zootermopsis nevadensis]
MAALKHTILISVTLAVLLSSTHLIRPTVAARTNENDCKILTSDLKENSPLILKTVSRSGESPFHMPKTVGSDLLTFRRGTTVRVACPDVKNNKLLLPKSDSVESEENVICIKDSTFNVNGELQNFSSIRCDHPPRSAIKEDGYCNATNMMRRIIGFNLKDEFIEVIEVCYDLTKQVTVHTRHSLNRNIVYKESENIRRNDTLLEFFETPDQFYICKNQVATLRNLLQSKNHAQKYIDCDKGGNRYLTKAHLVPKGDLLFEFQQKITSYDINTAPQWQTINTGHWRILENRIRRYANRHNADMTIISGTMDVMTLPDRFGIDQNVYLTKGEERNITMPVPAIFWKLVHDRARNAGIVFLLVNNPHHQDFETTRGYFICECVCSETSSWFDGWNRYDIRKGYVYCCTIDDFSQKTGMKSFSFRVRNLLH